MFLEPYLSVPFHTTKYLFPFCRTLHRSTFRYEGQRSPVSHPSQPVSHWSAPRIDRVFARCLAYPCVPRWSFQRPRVMGSFAQLSSYLNDCVVADPYDMPVVDWLIGFGGGSTPGCPEVDPHPCPPVTRTRVHGSVFARVRVRVPDG